MELTSRHREALLHELEKAEADQQIQRNLIEKVGQNEVADLVDWFEISDYLATERIKLIKQAIIKSDIDY